MSARVINLLVIGGGVASGFVAAVVDTGRTTAGRGTSCGNGFTDGVEAEAEGMVDSAGTGAGIDRNTAVSAGFRLVSSSGLVGAASGCPFWSSSESTLIKSTNPKPIALPTSNGGATVARVTIKGAV